MIENKLILSTIILLLFSAPMSANPHSGPKPIAVVNEYDEWNICNGISEMVLYEDGTFLFAECIKNENRPMIKYKIKKLTTEEFQKISKQLGPTETFMSLERDYILSSNIEAPDVDIYLSDKQNQKVVTVSYDDFELSGGVPKEFIRVYNLMQSIPREGATEYKPEYFEIWLNSPTDSTLKTIPWPKDMPSLSDRYTRSYVKDTYCIYVPNAKSKEINKYASRLKKNKKLTLLDSRKWQLGIKPAYPSASSYYQVMNLIYGNQ